MNIGILNGPNLNLLGIREPNIYGNTSFEGFLDKLKQKYAQLQFDYFQSNSEGALIDKLQEQDQQSEGIILNAGAYTHTSIALADTIKAIQTPVIEVHISNTFGRESFRHHSYLSPHVKGVIVGFGLSSYELAVQSFLIEK